jgi:hypothetical protein
MVFGAATFFYPNLITIKAGYDIPPLGPGANYIPPQINDTLGFRCDCNTVIYS